jgi:hypothetical protein
MTVLNISSFMSNVRRTAQLDSFKPLVNPDVPEQRAFIASDRHSTVKAAGEAKQNVGQIKETGA